MNYTFQLVDKVLKDKQISMDDLQVHSKSKAKKRKREYVVLCFRFSISPRRCRLRRWSSRPSSRSLVHRVRYLAQSPPPPEHTIFKVT